MSKQLLWNLLMTFARGARAALVDSGTPGLGAISLFYLLKKEEKKGG